MGRIRLLLATLPLLGVIGVGQAQAQSITPAADGTGTIATPNGNQFNIIAAHFPLNARTISSTISSWS